MAFAKHGVKRWPAWHGCAGDFRVGYLARNRYHHRNRGCRAAAESPGPRPQCASRFGLRLGRRRWESYTRPRRILNSRPTLGWRDLQHILVRISRPSADHEFRTPACKQDFTTPKPTFHAFTASSDSMASTMSKRKHGSVSRLVVGTSGSYPKVLWLFFGSLFL